MIKHHSVRDEVSHYTLVWIEVIPSSYTNVEKRNRPRDVLNTFIYIGTYVDIKV